MTDRRGQALPELRPQRLEFDRKDFLSVKAIFPMNRRQGGEPRVSRFILGKDALHDQKQTDFQRQLKAFKKKESQRESLWLDPRYYYDDGSPRRWDYAGFFDVQYRSWRRSDVRYRWILAAAKVQSWGVDDKRTFLVEGEFLEGQQCLQALNFCATDLEGEEALLGVHFLHPKKYDQLAPFLENEGKIFFFGEDAENAYSGFIVNPLTRTSQLWKWKSLLKSYNAGDLEKREFAYIISLLSQSDLFSQYDTKRESFPISENNFVDVLKRATQKREKRATKFSLSHNYSSLFRDKDGNYWERFYRLFQLIGEIYYSRREERASVVDIHVLLTTYDVFIQLSDSLSPRDMVSLHRELGRFLFKVEKDLPQEKNEMIYFSPHGFIYEPSTPDLWNLFLSLMKNKDVLPGDILQGLKDPFVDFQTCVYRSCLSGEDIAVSMWTGTKESLLYYKALYFARDSVEIWRSSEERKLYYFRALLEGVMRSKEQDMKGRMLEEIVLLYQKEDTSFLEERYMEYLAEEIIKNLDDVNSLQEESKELSLINYVIQKGDRTLLPQLVSEAIKKLWHDDPDKRESLYLNKVILADCMTYYGKKMPSSLRMPPDVYYEKEIALSYSRMARDYYEKASLVCKKKYKNGGSGAFEKDVRPSWHRRREMWMSPAGGRGHLFWERVYTELQNSGKSKVKTEALLLLIEGNLCQNCHKKENKKREWKMATHDRVRYLKEQGQFLNLKDLRSMDREDLPVDFHKVFDQFIAVLQLLDSLVRADVYVDAKHFVETETELYIKAFVNVFVEGEQKEYELYWLIQCSPEEIRDLGYLSHKVDVISEAKDGYVSIEELLKSAKGQVSPRDYKALLDVDAWLKFKEGGFAKSVLDVGGIPKEILPKRKEKDFFSMGKEEMEETLSPVKTKEYEERDGHTGRDYSQETTVEVSEEEQFQVLPKQAEKSVAKVKKELKKRKEDKESEKNKSERDSLAAFMYEPDVLFFERTSRGNQESVRLLKEIKSFYQEGGVTEEVEADMWEKALYWSEHQEEDGSLPDFGRANELFLDDSVFRGRLQNILEDVEEPHFKNRLQEVTRENTLLLFRDRLQEVVDNIDFSMVKERLESLLGSVGDFWIKSRLQDIANETSPSLFKSRLEDIVKDIKNSFVEIHLKKIIKDTEPLLWKSRLQDMLHDIEALFRTFPLSEDIVFENLGMEEFDEENFSEEESEDDVLVIENEAYQELSGEEDLEENERREYKGREEGVVFENKDRLENRIEFEEEEAEEDVSVVDKDGAPKEEVEKKDGDLDKSFSSLAAVLIRFPKYEDIERELSLASEEENEIIYHGQVREVDFQQEFHLATTMLLSRMSLLYNVNEENVVDRLFLVKEKEQEGHFVWEDSFALNTFLSSFLPHKTTVKQSVCLESSIVILKFRLEDKREGAVYEWTTYCDQDFF